MNPEASKQPNRTMDYRGNTFEVVDLHILTPKDIARGDRVLIGTESGNRYMVRRSESRNGVLMIYNEKTGNFEKGNPLHLKTKEDIIAEIGKEMKFIAVTDERRNLGSDFTSTKVNAIEIRKGLDAAIQSAPEQKGDLGSLMAKMLHEHTVEGKSVEKIIKEIKK